MQTRTCALAALACLLAAAPSPANDNELTSVLSAVAGPLPGGVEAIAAGSLRIAWRRDGPELAVADLATLDDLRRHPDPRPHHPPAHDDACHLFASFRHSTRNRLGGRTSASAERGEARIEPTWDDEGVGIARVTYAREAEGSVVVRTRLHDPDPFQDVVHYLDGRAFETIAFWYRGDAPARVGITDAAHDDGGTPRDLGPLAELTVEHAASSWRLAEIALADLPEAIDPKLLAELTLTPIVEKGTLDLGPMALCRDGLRPAPPSAPGPTPATPRTASGARRDGQALWVWHTRDAMSDVDRRDELVSLLRNEGFDRVYLQLPRGFASTDIERRRAAHGPLRELVRAITAAGAEAHALDGAADFALPGNHDDVVASIEALDSYNQASPPEARIAGVHLDVEPYLLPGFSGTDRSVIVDGYLTLLERVGAVTGPAELYFEVAIPFWFDTVLVHGSSGDVEGSELFQPLSEATIDRVDAVALMDYRTRADGSAGTVALAASELDYAAAHATDIRIGLETTWLPDEETLRFNGPATPGLPSARSSRPWIVAAESTEGIVFFAVPHDALPTLVGHLADIGVEPEDAFHWRASARIRVPADRLTFHDLGIEPLRDVVAATVRESVRYPSFAGVAIHYDRTYGRLLQPRP